MTASDESQSADPSEKLSESERHWDIVCLTVVTLATAAFGALVVLSGIQEAGQSKDFITGMEVAASITTLLAAGSTS